MNQVLRVAARCALNESVAHFRLESSSGSRLRPWSPGAHVEIELGSGAVRHYSLCGDPADPYGYEIAVRRDADGRGGSVELHDQVTAGSALRVSEPRNHFELQPADRYLFIAGGIGITPILPMIRAAEAAGTPWDLIYVGRSRRSMAFLDDLARWPSHVTLWPKDELGTFDIASAVGVLDEPTAIYCCGSPSLLENVQERCVDRDNISLRFELFEAPTSGRSTDREFEVELAESGKILTVRTGASILDTIQDAGVDVPSSCGAGTCGTCETVVRSGVPDHRDVVLTPEEHAEGRYMMICVSRAKSLRLVLER
jgi:ferredoxin-NADP reductase